MSKKQTYVTENKFAESMAEIIGRIRELEEDVEESRTLEFYTRREAAKLLNISVCTVDRYIAANKLRAAKMSAGRTLIRKAELRKLINSLERDLYTHNKGR